MVTLKSARYVDGFPAEILLDRDLYWLIGQEYPCVAEAEKAVQGESRRRWPVLVEILFGDGSTQRFRF